MQCILIVHFGISIPNSTPSDITTFTNHIPMNYTQAQIDRANAVSLEDFLRTQGETLIKSGREYRWKEHDSLTVRGNKWFRHSQSKGGYPIDFVIEFYGKSFPES